MSSPFPVDSLLSGIRAWGERLAAILAIQHLIVYRLIYGKSTGRFTEPWRYLPNFQAYYQSAILDANDADRRVRDSLGGRL